MFIKICTLFIVFVAVANAAPSQLLRKTRETTLAKEPLPENIENVQAVDAVPEAESTNIEKVQAVDPLPEAESTNIENVQAKEPETVAEATNVENVQVSDSEWEEFKAKFSKTYEDAADEAERRGIYLESKKFVEAHNQQYKEGKTSFTVGINQFADRKPHEKKQRLGLILPRDRHVKDLSAE